MSTENHTANLPDLSVAIVGMAGQFPGANGIRQFWRNLVDGVKSIRTFSDEQLLAEGVAPERLADPNFVKAGTVVDDIDLFDASFFGFSPREAEAMDPQARLFLQCAWAALEDAAYVPENYAGQIGVFAGKFPSTYRWRNLVGNAEVLRLVGELQIATGNDHDALAPMVSYKFDLTGPSLSLQTFCSTSLVAVHLACQSLLAYECDMALAGGVAIQIPQGQGYLYEEGGLLSPDGECRVFDAGANGMVAGNGLGVIVLRRLEDAINDGDHIYAVIRGSAVTNDGLARVGFVAPGVRGQAAAMATALGNAGVDAETISYIEAHGTGTPMGDSVELRALIKAYQQRTDKKGFCALGSVKPNIGHLDRAAGVVSLIKAALALQQKTLPPSLNFEKANPDIRLEQTPFYVNTECRPWVHDKPWPRRAGVSSFGLGGTNVHMILEEAPAPEPSGPSRPYQLLLLSAKSEDALERMSHNLARYLQEHPALNLADVAYTLQTGRAQFNHRRMVVGRDSIEVAEALAAVTPGRVFSRHQTFRQRPVAFLLPGVNDYYTGMGRELYEREPIFRHWVDHCRNLLQGHLAVDLRDWFYAADVTGQASDLEPESRLHQCALFVVEYALAQLLLSWGIRPQRFMGQGVGEWVSACLAGALSPAEALTALAERSGMTAVATNGASKKELSPQLPEVTLNGPELPALDDCVVLMLGVDPNAKTVLRPQGAWPNLAGPILSLLPGPDIAATESAFLMETVGKLWLAGVEIDWPGFHQKECRRRLSLPAYSFDRQRYWIEESKIDQPSHQPMPSQNGRAAEGKKADIGDWFYQPLWKQTPNWRRQDSPLLTADRGLWLLFEDGEGCGALVAGMLEKHGCPAVRVRIGTQFGRLDENIYSLNPSEPADYGRLLQALPQAPRQIVHFWGMEPVTVADSPVARFGEAQRLGFYSLHFLVKALNQSAEKLSLWIVTAQAQFITGQERFCPEKMIVWGQSRVIAQENLNVTCRCIDLSWPPGDSSRRSWLVNQLLSEFTQETDDLAVAYRGKQRWSQVYEPVHLPAAETPAFRQGGVYLITGGLGPVGVVLARHLAASAQAKVVLTGRSPFPARDTWADWVAEHDADDPIRRGIEQIREMEALGAEIKLIQADVTDEAQMTAALAQIDAQFGALNGVIHAAGAAGEQYYLPLQEMTAEQCEAHFGPKVYGLYTLEKVLADRPLDFCLLFSSLTAVLGGLGCGAYAPANDFMNAFVRQHNFHHDQAWYCVSWDTWRTRENQHETMGATIAEYEMLPDEGIQALQRVIAYGPPDPLVVSTGELEARLDQWVRLVSLRQGEGETETVVLHPRPDLETPFIEPEGEVEQHIAEIWQELLGIQPVGAQDNFLDLGGHSLIATHMMMRLQQYFQVAVPLSLVFTAPTVAELAIAIEMAIIDELETFEVML